MLKRLFDKTVELSVGGGRLRFKDVGELEYALRDKTALSSASVSALGKLPDDALTREAESFRSMEQRIVEALSSPGNGFEAFLERLDLDRVSEDHDWRELMGAVRALDGSKEAYKKAALLKYVAYLSAAQDVIRTIRVNRLGATDADDPLPRGSDQSDVTRKQHLIFDPPELSGAGGAAADENGFARMSKGEPVEIQFGEHQSLELVLGKYRFLLVSGEPFHLVDETGHDLKLARGKNVVGRSARCGASVGAAFGAVSRKHLILEIGQNHRVRLTDISTLGTFLPRELIGGRLH